MGFLKKARNWLKDPSNKARSNVQQPQPPPARHHQSGSADPHPDSPQTLPGWSTLLTPPVNSTSTSVPSASSTPLAPPGTGSPTQQPGTLAPHSCATCQRLIVPDPASQASGTRQGEEKNFVHFNFDLADLLASPQDCLLCAHLLQTEWVHRSSIADRFLANRNIDPSDPESAVILAVAEAWMRHDTRLPPPDPTRTLRYWVKENDEERPEDLRLACFYHEHRVKFFALWDVPRRRIAYRTREGFAVCARIGQGNPAARFVSTRPIEPDLLASATLKKVSAWLTECLEGKVRGKQIHDRCPRPKPDFLPKRLIEISDHPSPASGDQRYSLKLINTDGLPLTKYVALSYCWGGDQPLKTTKSNLASWLQGIPWDRLPQTLKDAVIVCAKLDIRHIWIDAMCIVQDDPDDFNIEIGKMGSVYQNSTLTLAVARAARVTDGFLQPRDVAPDNTFELPFQCHQPDTLGTIALLKATVSTEPLDTRGWTLQERLLAPRTLEFGSRQTRFFCQHNPRGYTDGWTLAPENTGPRSDTLQDVQVLHAESHVKSDHKIEAYSLEFEEAMNNWLKLVEAYTHRHLTVSTDRIIAISGIAALYGEVFGDQYCAGLWRAGCPRALFWQQSGKRQKRPQGWQGPSWSWASITGPVKFPISSEMDEDASPVLDIEIEHANVHNPYGALAQGSGRLTVRARLNSAVLLFADGGDSDIHAGVVVLHRHDEEGNAAVRTFKISYDALDETEAERKENNVVVLELQSKCTAHRWMSRGLMCRSLGDDAFVRVGTFEYLTVQDSRRNEESDDEWYRRVDRDLNWFKGLKYDQYSIF